MNIESNSSPEISYPQETVDNKETPTTTSLLIYHAPFSLLHIEEESNINSQEVNLADQSGYYIPETKEILGEKLKNSINERIQTLPINKQSQVRKTYDERPEFEKLYGEFLPQTYKTGTSDLNGIKIEIGDSVDPIKYLTNIMTDRKGKYPNKKQEIVIHPDIIYFASQGRKENLDKVLEYFNKLATELDQKLFVENMFFTNEKYRKSLPIFEEPLDLYNLVGEYSNFGLVIDIQHLEKTGRNISLELLNNIPNDRLIIHSREGYKDEYKDIYTFCYKNGIPWVVEE